MPNPIMSFAFFDPPPCGPHECPEPPPDPECPNPPATNDTHVCKLWGMDKGQRNSPLLPGTLYDLSAPVKCPARNQSPTS